jgi:lipopolysaccharide/colanic/teichoic acid biosynthesis glycosyltransferase
MAGEAGGQIPNPYGSIKRGATPVGSLLAILTLALLIGTSFGLSKIFGIVAGLLVFYVAGSIITARIRDQVYEAAFSWRGLGNEASPVKHFGVSKWSGRPGPEPPPFVARNVMKEVEDGLKEKQLVLLEGPRTSGKSRLIFELSRDQMVLVAAPAPPNEEDRLRALIKDRRGLASLEGKQLIVVRAFADRVKTGNLNADSLRSLLERNRGLSIIATLSPEERTKITDEGEVAERWLEEFEDLGAKVELAGELEGEELETARFLYPELDEAQLVNLPREMVAENPLRERLDETAAGHLGRDLVLAAAAWRRVGLARRAPSRFLRAALEKTGPVGDDEFEAALAWALTPVRDGVRLLYGGEGEETLYEVDPVVRDLLHEADRYPFPTSTWQAIFDEIARRDVDEGNEVVAAELLALGEAALAEGLDRLGRHAIEDARYLGNSAQKERCARALTSGTRISSFPRLLVDSRRGDSIARRFNAAQTRAVERQEAMTRSPDPEGPGRLIAEIYARRILRAFLRVTVLMIFDLFSVFLGLWAGLVFRTLLAGEDTTFDELQATFVAFLPGWGVATIFLFALLHLYRQDSPRARFGPILLATGTLGAVGLAAGAAADFDPLIFLPASVAGTLVAALVDYWLRGTYDAISSGWVWDHSLAAPTLLVGSPEQVARLEKSVEIGVTRPMRICGYLSTRGDPHSDLAKFPETPYRGTMDHRRHPPQQVDLADLEMGNLSRAIVDLTVGRVLIVDWAMSRVNRQAIADRCHIKSVAVEAVATYADIQAGTGRSIPGQSLVLIPMVPLWRGNTAYIAKRLIDLVGASLLIVILSPLLLLTMLAILIFDRRGPITVTALRHGVGRDVFRMYRFKTAQAPTRARSLEDPADTEELTTALGRFLRRHRIDELPQLYNVLRGHMSLVGPRPLRMDDDYRLGDRDLLRYVVPPGATGLCQISGRDRMSIEEMTALDMAYLRNWSVIGDLEILVKTVRAVFKGGGQQKINHPDETEGSNDLAAFG